MSAVAKIAPTAQPVLVYTTLGVVTLRPGTMWSGNRMLVLASTSTVHYTIGDRLYEWNTQPFIRDELLNGLSAGAQRARGMVTLAKIEMAFISGLMVPWYVLLAVSCGKLGLFYHDHKKHVDDAMSKAPRVLALLQKMRSEHPMLFNKVVKTAMKDVLTHLPESVSGEDIAFFVGRVLKGVDAAPAITLGAIIKITLVVATLVTASHLPAITAHAVQHAAKERAADLEKRLKEAGYTVTRNEAEVILRDALGHADTDTMLKELEASSKALVPSLEVLNKLLVPTK